MNKFKHQGFRSQLDLSEQREKKMIKLRSISNSITNNKTSPTVRTSQTSKFVINQAYPKQNYQMHKVMDSQDFT